MPKSKRNKVVTLTDTKKKGYDRKVDLVSEIQKCCDTYNSLYLFSVDNMRNGLIKNVRTEWRTSRFFFGKNKVVAFGLGKSKENEYKDNLFEVTKRMSGQVVLMFTNEPQDDVRKWFASYAEAEYARPGNTATEEFSIPEGALDENTYPPSMEPNLRQLGLPTTLVKGIVHMKEEFTVCKEGDTLTADQCTILKRFYKTMVEFKMEPQCAWHSSGVFEELSSSL